MKILLSLVPAALLAVLAAAVQVTVSPTGSIPQAQAAGSLPSGWPASLQLGVSDSPGGAAALKAKAPFGFRYQYLAGGVNTGNGWANWNPNGQFVSNYVQESVANGITPVFTYYMIAQSAPASSSGESAAVSSNLQNTSTMTAYWNDLKLFFQRAGASTNPVVLHVEPDMWGFLHSRSGGDNAAAAPVRVAATGIAELSGLPNDLRGYAQAVIRLRDRYAPNVKLGYHLSAWAMGEDPFLSNSSNARIDQLASKAGAFYNSLGANFDVAFSEFTDRDAAFKQYRYGDGAASWWDAADFSRHVRLLAAFSGHTQKRIVLWQIPQGNTKMRAMNNTWNHYQDNRVEWLLDEPSRSHLTAYINAGVIAFLFGRGADGATCACDANGDGTTNPAPINGNTQTSLNADDDGGFFRQKAAAYYSTGAMSLSGGSPGVTATPTTTATSTPATTPTATPRPATPVPPPAGSWSTSATSSLESVRRGATETLTVSVTSGSTTTALVDVEIYAPNGARVYQTYFDSQSFTAGTAKRFTVTWRPPSNAALGTYTVRVGAFRVGWGALYHWNNSADTFTVVR